MNLSLLSWTLFLLAVVTGIFLTAAKRAKARLKTQYPPIGQMIDIGGYRLHTHVEGEGTPTVILDAGAGGIGLSWELVRPAIARVTRVVTYDRAGLGWSDALPLPQDAAQFARELHTLLQNANVPGPYVLVGHSLGGFIVRIFARDYASEVNGVVLIDSMNPKQVTASPPNSQSRPFSFQALLARFGIARLLVKLPGIAPHVPEPAYYPLYIRPGSLQATDNEYQTLPASAAQAATVETFGDLPLIVLTAKLNRIQGWPDWQTELLQLSSHSQHLFAEKSGHNIQTDEPEAAVAAILQMVQQVRETGTR